MEFLHLSKLQQKALFVCLLYYFDYITNFLLSAKKAQHCCCYVLSKTKKKRQEVVVRLANAKEDVIVAVLIQSGQRFSH